MQRNAVLITGSSRGLGKSLGLTFAADGYNVILHGRAKETLSAVQRSVSSHGVECAIVTGDLCSDETIRQLAEVAAEWDISVLVNNAGEYWKGPFEEQTIDQIRRMVEINLIAPISLIQRTYPIFKRKRSGTIVNINSVAGKYPAPGEYAYAASKHGFRGFTSSFRLDAIKDGIRVVDVYLGAMRTDMTKERMDSEKFIAPDDAAKFIFHSVAEYTTMRVDEVELRRAKY